MANKAQPEAADFIVPLDMNGLHGRMLRMPAPAGKKREMLLIYGHHSSLERWFGVAQDLNQYGAVTMPDLPGFGGMQSFYHIGERPTLDNLADYLASFIKLRYKRKRLTIMGMSFGFLVVTRMLQKYPELAKKVDMVVSIVGFVHHDAFVLKRSTYQTFKLLSRTLGARLPALFVRYVFLQGPIIAATYRLVGDRNVKMKDADVAERKKRIKFEIGLWHSNEVRTYMYTSYCMLTVDLCNVPINKPVFHIAVSDDRYFDNNRVEQHLRIIFSSVKIIPTSLKGHAPTVTADAKAAAPFIPARMRRLLKS